MMTSQVDQYIDIVFDGPPEPNGGRFVTIEDREGQELEIGEWLEERGRWRLRIRVAEISVQLYT